MKKARGDRKDGKFLRKLDAYYAFTPFVMTTRNDSSNTFQDTIEVTEIERYLRRKREEGFKGMGMLHLFIAAYIRVISQRPALNRFVVGQRIYASNDITYVMSIKKEMTSSGGETSIKVKFSPTDTIDDVYNKINAEVDKVRNGEDTNTDDVAETLMKIPRVMLKMAMWFVRLFDYFGLLPQFLLDASPFHGSFIITDMGSLGIQPIYHHLYNFGTLPLFLAFGAKRKTYEVMKDGSVEPRKYIDYKVCVDERICDGFYFAQSLKYMKSYVRHPETLDVPPEKVVQDVGF